MTQCCFNVGLPSSTSALQKNNIGSTPHVCLGRPHNIASANTRRWPNAVSMLGWWACDGRQTSKQHWSRARILIQVTEGYIVGFGLVELAISTNPKPTMYRNVYENTGPGVYIYIRLTVDFCVFLRLVSTASTGGSR